MVSFGLYRNVPDWILTVWVQPQSTLVIMGHDFRHHNDAFVFLVANDVRHFFPFWVNDSFELVQLGLVNLFFHIMDFFLLFKFIFQLCQFSQSLVVNFLEVLVLYFQHLNLLRVSRSCCVVGIGVIWGVGWLLAHPVDDSNFDSLFFFLGILITCLSFWSAWTGFKLLFEPIELATADQYFVLETLCWYVIFSFRAVWSVVEAQNAKSSSIGLNTVIGTTMTFSHEQFLFWCIALGNLMSNGERWLNLHSSWRFGSISVFCCGHFVFGCQ